MKSKLNYVFEVSVLSCDPPCADARNYWISRCRVMQSNECASTPWQIAANICAHYMRADEQGVQVKFLGLRKEKDPMITPMGNFTIELMRDES